MTVLILYIKEFLELKISLKSLVSLINLHLFAEQLTIKSYFFTYDTKNDANGDAVTLTEWIDYLKAVTVSYGRPIDTLTIFAHGSPASINMSDGFKLEDNLATRLGIERLMNENILAPDATILLFSCDVAQGSAGEAFIQNLADWSGAILYSSSNRTGPYVQTGDFISQDWDLDVVKQPSNPAVSQAPLAVAESPFSASANTVVALNGSKSTDPDDGIASYFWEQLSGVTVSLSDANSIQPVFIAPNVTQSETVSFQMTVTDYSGQQSTDTCTTTITTGDTLPSNPTGVNVHYQSSFGWNYLTWNHISAAASYKVYWSTGPGVTFASNEMPETMTNDYGHTGVVSGSCYYYRVSAVNSVGEESGLSSEVYVCLSENIPDIPNGINVAHQESSGRNYITWNHAANANGYKVYWGTNPGVTTASNVMPETATTDYGHTGVENGSCYYYRVSAVNSTDESDLSSEASVCVSEVIPVIPTGVTVIYQSSENQNFIDWNPSSGSTNYKVYWGTSPGVTFASNVLTETTTTDYGHTGVVGGSCYYYKVSAVNTEGESALSDETSVCLPSLVPDAPTDPVALHQTIGNRNYITWSQAANATNYKVYWDTSPGVSKTSMLMTETVSTDSRHYDVISGSCYYYRISSVNSEGESGLSPEVSVCITEVQNLSVNPTSWSAPTEGGTSELIQITNSAGGATISFTVAENADWLSLSASTGVTPNGFIITAAANDTAFVRNADVIVTATGVFGSPKNILVTQDAASSHELAISPNPINYFGVEVGSTSQQKNITITNSGTKTIDINSISIIGTDAAEYSIPVTFDNCSGIILTAGDSCSVAVEFSPSSEADKLATLSLSSLTPEVGTVNVSITGTGIRAGTIAITDFDTIQNFIFNGAVAYYAIDLYAGQGITVSINAHMTTGYIDFGLYDPYEVELSGSNDSAIYDAETGKLSFTPAKTGVYYIKVWAPSSAVGNYDLAVYSAWFNAGVQDSDRTFNSTYSTSHYIANGSYPVLDTGISTDQGINIYRFTVPGNTQVDVALTSHLTAGGLDFGIFDNDQVELAGSNDSNITDGQTGTAGKLIIEPGVYYVRVWEDSDAAGTYDLTIVGAEPDQDTDGDGLSDAAEYYLGTSNDNDDTDGDGVSDYDEIMQGSNPGVAAELSVAEVSGATSLINAVAMPVFDKRVSIEHSGSETWYSFDLAAGEAVTVALSAYLNRGALDFHLFDSSGTYLAGSGDADITDGQTGIANLTVTAAGTYYIRVWESSNAFGNYDLAVYNAWFNPGVVDSQRDFNDTFNTAYYIQNGNYSATELGLDYYRIDLTAGQAITVALTSHLDRGGLDFGLYDSNGTELSGSNDSSITNGQTGRAEKLVYESGTYFIRVWEDSAAVGNYDLAVYSAWFNAGVQDSDRTFNSTYSTSHYIANGSYPVLDTGISTDQGINIYRFTVPGNTQVDVALTSHLTAGGLDFGIFDNDQVELAGSNDSNITDGQTGTAGKLIIEPGVYYVRVWEDSDAAGTYDLTIVGAEPDQDTDGDGLSDAAEYYLGTSNDNDDTDGDGVSDYDEIMQGSNPGVAAELSVAEVSGATSLINAVAMPVFDKRVSIEHSGSETWYSFDLAAGEAVTVALSAYLNRGALDFHLFDSSGTYLAGSGDADITDGQTGIANLTVTAAGTYYIRVWESSNAFGNYDLAVYNAWFNPGVVDSQRDFNDTFNTAYYIQNGNYSATELGLDYYRIDLTAGQAITVALTSHLDRGGLDFGLYDSNGTELSGSNDSSITNGQTGRAEKLVYESGTYFIRVWEDSAAVGNYDLAVYSAWFNAGVQDSDRTFNSTYSTSHYIANGSYPVLDTGISTDQGINIYRFTVPGNTQVDVALTSHLTAGGLDFGIFDNDQVELAGSNDSNITDGQTGTAGKLIIEPGVYYVRVWEDSDAAGTYDLTIVGAEPDQDTDGDGLSDAAEYYLGTSNDNDDTDGDGVSDYDEIMQGSNPGVAAELSVAEVSGATSLINAVAMPVFDKRVSIEHSGSETWYSFDLAAGEAVTVALSAYLNRGALDFHLFDSSGTYLAGSGDADITDGQTGIANLTVTAAGTYYIRVWESSNAFGNYDLAVYNAWFNPGVVDSQRDFNDTFNTAYYVQNGNYSATELGQDYYRFEANNTSTVVVSVEAHLNRGGLDFGLFNSNGVEIVGSNDSNISNGQTGTATLPVTTSDIYYIKIWEYADAKGNYDIIITGNDDSEAGEFSASVTSGLAPLYVAFSDLSTGTINSWLWAFGNGQTSTEQNPEVNYDLPGTYTVSLTVTGPGGSDTETKTNYILVSEPDFDGDGIVDSVDNCPSEFNPDQANFDGDGSGDLCDLDDDNDGMSDWYENNYGLDPFNPNDAQLDPDDDGFMSIQEFHYQTDPNDADSKACSICRSDFNFDGIVDELDLYMFSYEFGTANCNVSCGCDTNRDDDVDGNDLLKITIESGRSDCDQDGDSWPDRNDNCPCTYNPDQSDLDDDGIGDDCD